MNKQDHGVSNQKKTSILTLFKNAKFVILNLLILLAFSVAILSGNGKEIALNFYNKVTGQQFESFSAVEEYTSEPYLILKHKLLQDRNINIEHADVKVFNEQASSFKYRVIINKQVLLYKIKKNANGIWNISDISEK